VRSDLPVRTGLATIVTDRIERLRRSDDRGAIFWRYGVPLLIAALLTVAFTDIEDDVPERLNGMVASLKTALSASVHGG
jgi:hypothetical protein